MIKKTQVIVTEPTVTLEMTVNEVKNLKIIMGLFSSIEIDRALHSEKLAGNNPITGQVVTGLYNGLKEVVEDLEEIHNL